MNIFSYASAGRPVWSDGFYVTYGYDACGRLNAVYNSNSSVLWSCSYDAAGRRTQTTGVYGLTTDYDYEDVSSTLEDERGIYLDGLSNTLGSLSLDFTYSRDLAGNITTETSGGVDISYLYDKNYSLTSVDYETGDDITFDYDNLLNRMSVVEGTSTTNYTKYTNGLNQYSTVGTANVEYDDNGNLTQQGTWHYLYNSENQMIATYNLTGDPNEVAVSLYGYDEFGRRTNKASAVGVESTTGSIAESYVYDGFQVIGEYDTDGLHIKRRFIYAARIDEPICMVVEPQHQGWYGLDEFKTIAYSWLCEDGDACYNSEYDFNANDAIDANDLSQFVADYYLDDRPLLGNSEYYGYVFDGTGNVVAMTYCEDPNETGNPNETPYFIETYTYDVFGIPTIYDANSIEVSESVIGNPYMFTARRFDNESGLYYYRYRMYSPQLGRFMQTDPLGYYDSMNLYQYCWNNSVNYIDPLGLKFDIVRGIGDIIGGIGTGIGLVASDIATHFGPPSFYVEGQNGTILPVKVFESRSGRYNIPGISRFAMNAGGVIHIGPEMAAGLMESQRDRGGKLCKPARYNDRFSGTVEERTMAHELGHQVDADKWGIFYPLLGFVMTQDRNSVFEQNASFRGEYYRIVIPIP